MCADTPNTDQLHTLALARCELHPGNRKRLGAMKELTEDIRQNGIEVPLIGRFLNTEATRASYPKRNDGLHVFQVLAGARRLTAARTLKLETLPVLERQFSDDEALRFLMRENLHREDVHPLDEADYFVQLIEQGANVEMIAAELGKSESFVHKRLQLHQLTPASRKLYEAGKFGAAVAMELARLPKTAQDDLLHRIKDHIEFDRTGGEVGPKMVRAWALNHHVLKLAHAAFSPKDPDLWKAAGPCTACPKRAGNTPSLFGDLTTEDACTDRKCYEQKALKHLDNQIAKLEAEGIDWTPVSNNYSQHRASEQMFRGKQVLFEYSWNECRQKDEDAFRAVLVSSPHPGHIGRTLWARRPPRTAAYKPSPQQKAAEAAAARRHKISGFYRRLVFQAVHETAVSQTELDLKAIALAFFKRLWSDVQKEIAKSYNWELLKQKEYSGWDLERTAAERIKVMTLAEVRQFLNALTIAHDVKHSQYYPSNCKDELVTKARALGVDVAKLKRQAEAKFPTAKKKTTKKKAAKKT